MKILLNEEFVDDNSAAVSVWDAGLLYGHGVYETMRTFDGQLKLVDEHLKRLRASAEALYIGFPFSLPELKTKLLELILLRQQEEPDCDFRIRMTLTGGIGNLRQEIDALPTLIITASKLDVADQKPLILQSFEMIRQLPTAKTTAMLPAILGQHYAAEYGADEALLVDDAGIVHEGSFSNIYLVKGGVLRYPASGSLPGVTQRLIAQLTKDLLPSYAAELTLDDFYNADEVFTSGAVRGIVAVRQINNHKFSAPGPYTIKLQTTYKMWSNA